MRKVHASLKFRSAAFFAREHAHLAPFVSREHLRSLVREADKAEEAVKTASLTIDSSAPHIAGKHIPPVGIFLFFLLRSSHRNRFLENVSAVGCQLASTAVSQSL
jgi:hypothetical protein